MTKAKKIPVTQKIVSIAIDNTLAERSKWLKNYYSLFKESAKELSEPEKDDLFFALNKSERMVYMTGKRLQSFSNLFEKISAVS